MSTTHRTRAGYPDDMPNALQSSHLFDMRVDLSPPQVVTGPEGLLLIAIAQGGWFEGQGIRGVVLPGGGDWIRVGTDRVARLDVRVTLRSDDDQLIYITTTGVCRLGDEGIVSYWAGGRLHWDETYARGAIRFQTGAERYAFLNATQTMAVMELGQDQVSYRVFAIE